MGKALGLTQTAKILVVDDLPANLRLLGNLLREQGYQQVRLAPSGKLALESACRFQPDLILLDIMMPEMDGYDVCKALKANPQTQDIPIVFLSALGEDMDKAKAFAVGGADYITKPFQMAETIARVELQLRERSLRQQLQWQNEQLQAEIRERSLLEQRLSASERKLRAMFESMHDIVLAIALEEGQIADIDLLPTHWSCQMSSGVDWVGIFLEQVLNEATNHQWLQQIDRALQQQTTVNWDLCLQADAQELWLSAAISPWADRGVIVVARDISDRKRNEREIKLLLAANQAISQAGSLKEAIAAVLSLVCTTIFWDYGEAWQPNAENTVLTYVASLSDGDDRFAALAAYHQTLQLSCGEGLPGQIWQIQQPLWLDDCRCVEDDDPHREIAAKVGLKATFGIPILAGNRVLAILIFYHLQAMSCQPRLMELVSAVADRLGATILRKQAEVALQQQMLETEKLLLNILPRPVALRLKAGETPIADQFTNVSVLFADLVGFTHIAAQAQPKALVATLNTIFSEFDQLALEYGLEKIKTIGDAYMVVGGLPTPRADSARAIALMALAMQAAIAHVNTHTQQKFQLRIGIHVGTVVAGIIGMSKFSYDLWGDTVNLASRMESSGLPGKIQVTTEAFHCLKDEFTLKLRGPILIKGKGQLTTYWLLNQKENL
jgi:adenylate cyclase